MEKWVKNKDITDIKIGDIVRMYINGILFYRTSHAIHETKKRVWKELQEKFDESIEYNIIGITDGSGEKLEDVTDYERFYCRSPHYIGVKNIDDDSETWFQISHWYFRSKQYKRKCKLQELLD